MPKHGPDHIQGLTRKSSPRLEDGPTGNAARSKLSGRSLFLPARETGGEVLVAIRKPFQGDEDIAAPKRFRHVRIQPPVLVSRIRQLGHVLQGEQQQRVTALQPEFPADVPPVRLHRQQADAQPGRDLA